MEKSCCYKIIYLFENVLIFSADNVNTVLNLPQIGKEGVKGKKKKRRVEQPSKYKLAGLEDWGQGSGSPNQKPLSFSTAFQQEGGRRRPQPVPRAALGREGATGPSPEQTKTFPSFFPKGFQLQEQRCLKWESAGTRPGLPLSQARTRRALLSSVTLSFPKIHNV